MPRLEAHTTSAIQLRPIFKNAESLQRLVDVIHDGQRVGLRAVAPCDGTVLLHQELPKVPGNRTLIARGHLEPLVDRRTSTSVDLYLIHKQAGKALALREGLDLGIGARLLSHELVARKCHDGEGLALVLCHQVIELLVVLGRQASFGGNVDNQDGLPLERGKVDLLLVDIEGLQLVEALDVLDVIVIGAAKYHVEETVQHKLGLTSSLVETVRRTLAQQTGSGSAAGKRSGALAQGLRGAKGLSPPGRSRADASQRSSDSRGYG
mmetsp:Transcript_5994/g.10808  ORF Transcript_5994/g.10808 Transcript_5994/m.10808 type:complete len:265 (+) Transcript_5994:350-1144(+)